MNIDHQIVQYIRDYKHNCLRGLVVARKVSDDTVAVGWSYAAPFDKTIAMRVCEGRIRKGSNRQPPYEVRTLVKSMEKRLQRYFKAQNIELAGNFTP